MARKPRKPSRARSGAKRTSLAAPPRFRTPNAWRVVTARAIASAATGKSGRATLRYVPQIRLSGEWLERLGFTMGTRFLLSAEREFQTLILQAVED